MSSGNLWNAYRATDSYPGGMGADPTGVRDSGAALAYWLNLAGTNGGGIVELAPGEDYRTQRGLVVPAGVNLIGGGKGNTRILADDSLGNIGDIFTTSNVRNPSIREMCISALSPRTDGNAISVKGGDSTDALEGSIYGCDFEAFNIDMDSQFNGLVVTDGPGSAGNWKCHVSYGSWKNFSANGTAYIINTPNGASQFFREVFVYGPITPASGSTAVKILSTGDCTLTDCETWGFANGLFVVPSANGLTALTVNGGFYDQATNEALKIESAAAPASAQYLTFNGAWFATGGFGGTANTATVRSHNSTGKIRFNGCLFYHATDWGLVIDGANNVSVTGGHADANANGDIKLTGSAQSANICGVQLMSASVPGIQIDNGCVGHAVTGNNGKTNCVTDNSGAVSKVVANNL